jgi:hypothetical protein
MAAMQSELCAMNKRRASTFDLVAGVGGSGRQKSACKEMRLLARVPLV